VAVRGWQRLADAAPPALPRATAVEAQSVSRIVLSRVGTSITLVRDGDGWALSSPVRAPADRDAVEALLRTFARGVPMRATVGEGAARTFGLGNDIVVTVQLFGAGAAPLSELSVGGSAGGDEAFVQLPGDPTVYRADVGGRERLDRTPLAWRDRTVLEMIPEDVRDLEIVRPAGSATILRTASGSWILGRRGHAPSATPPPADPETVAGVLRLIAGLDALEVHPGDYAADFEHPAVEVRLGMRDGVTHRIVVGGHVESGGALLRVDTRPEVLRVPPRVAELLSLGPEDLADRRLLPVEASDVRGIALDEGGFSLVATRGEDGAWDIVRPANLAADGPALDDAAAVIVSLRAEGRVGGPPTGKGATTLRVSLRDGRTETLALGGVVRDAQGRPFLEVGTARGVVLVDGAALARVRRALGRG
jgi:hypothetical protein